MDLCHLQGPEVHADLSTVLSHRRHDMKKGFIYFDLFSWGLCEVRNSRESQLLLETLENDRFLCQSNQNLTIKLNLNALV